MQRLAIRDRASLYAQAQQVLPGGVCASARANMALGHPFHVSRGDGAGLFDLQGRRYVDMCTSHGASLLGHNHPAIKAAVQTALDLGILPDFPQHLEAIHPGHAQVQQDHRRA